MQTWALPALDQTHRAYLRAVEENLARLRDVERDPRLLLELEPLRDCAAAALPRHRRSHDLDDRRGAWRRAAIQIGIAHLRRVLVESAWHYRHHPFVGDTLRARQRGAPATIIAQAWTAQQRLHRRYQRFANRAKSTQHIVTAIARELTGFVWAALTH